jgi:hypothetical protein
MRSLCSRRRRLSGEDAFLFVLRQSFGDHSLPFKCPTKNCVCGHATGVKLERFTTLRDAVVETSGEK